LTRQLVARAIFRANSTAFWFRTGRLPGIPRQTSQTWVLGGAPKRVAQPQKILLAVSRWAWTSNPITASYSSVVLLNLLNLLKVT
jgi:hypothetical protein